MLRSLLIKFGIITVEGSVKSGQAKVEKLIDTIQGVKSDLKGLVSVSIVNNFDEIEKKEKEISTIYNENTRLERLYREIDKLAQ